jgi:hypothetical protein
MQNGEQIPAVPVWGRRQWMTGLIVAFIAQVVLIWSFSDRRNSVVRKDSRATHFKFALDPVQDTQIKVQDPTLFASANANGFSGEAWLNRRMTVVESQDWTAPGAWPEPLHRAKQEADLPGARAGVILNRPVAEKPTPLLASIPVPSERVETQSRLILTGPLLGRALVRSNSLPVISGSNVWRSSVVEVTVNNEGEIVSGRLVASSGNPGADLEGLRLARQVRFTPLAAVGTNAMPMSSTEQGQMIFRWASVPSVATNAGNTKP